MFLFVLPVLAVHKSAINVKFQGYHSHKNKRHAKLSMDRVKNNDREMNENLPGGGDPTFVKLCD